MNHISSNAVCTAYRRLLEAASRSTNTPLSALHAKVAVVDASWATVGSTNLDLLSLLDGARGQCRDARSGFRQGGSAAA